MAERKVADMSIPVELSALADVIARYPFAYLLTGSAHGAPHAVAVTPLLEGGALVVDGIGRRTRQNLLARPDVGLVWPPQSMSEYSLIVDGHASMDGEAVRIAPVRAVLHRPAPRPGPVAPGGCVSDCVELDLPATVEGASRG